jgi:hypothetical protein
MGWQPRSPRSPRLPSGPRLGLLPRYRGVQLPRQLGWAAPGRPGLSSLLGSSQVRPGWAAQGRPHWPCPAFTWATAGQVLLEFFYAKSFFQVPKVIRLCQLVFRSISHDKN